MRFVDDAKVTRMSMTYSHVEIAFRCSTTSSFTIPSIYENKNRKIAPFTASYQTIDPVKGINAFTLQDVAPQIERQEK